MTVILDSAKIQGFHWEENHYEFLHEDKTKTKVDVKIDEKTYLILVQRYKELFKKKSSDPEPPFDIDPHIVEIKTDAINNDYMNSRFRQFVRDLTKGDASTKQRNLDELHKTFAALSEEDQSFARQFLNDVENGLAVEENKDLTDYIAEYRTKRYNDQIIEISQGMGVDIDKLNELINLHPTESTINEYNRYDELFGQLDVIKARAFMENKLSKVLAKDREVKMEADSFLRNVILNGI